MARSNDKRQGGAARPRRRPSYRLVKTHLNYSVDEVARLSRFSKGTVRRWIKDGKLPAIVDKKPVLILGGDLSDFLKVRSAKRPKLALSHCYCFKCRGGRPPALGMLEYTPLNDSSGNLRALCADCSTVMHKAVSATVLAELARHFDLAIKQRERHLMDMPRSSLNDHLPEVPRDRSRASPIQ